MEARNLTEYQLGRNVNHDPRSRSFAFDTAGITPVSVKHVRRIPVLNQGKIGSCTGNATVGALGTDPFFNTVAVKAQLNETLAVKIYSQATIVDPFPGTYPPTDTGSNGVSVAKAAQGFGYISGYTHTFDFNSAIAALSTQPVIIGINWYNNFFTPAADGTLSISAKDYVAGGHEVVLDELDMQKQRVGGTNSWGATWGAKGRFYIPFALFKRLLSEQGDVTVFVPNTKAAPTPSPITGDPSLALWEELKSWASAPHSGSNRVAAKKVNDWAKAQGYIS